MKRFLTVKGVIGLVLVLVVLLTAVLAPLVLPAEFATRMAMTARLKPPSALYWLGTDQLGRNLFYRVVLGARTSLMIAGAAVGMSIVLGLPIGLVAGYWRGTVDNVLMRLVDTLLSFPVLLLALTISAMLGPSLPNTIIAIGVAFTPFLARIIRGEALRVAQMPYVEAARAAGTTDLQMILRHILPNIMPPIIVQATISLAFAILAEAGLSFLGLGTQPPQSSWGLMIQASRDYLDVAPWTALVPGAAVAIAVLGLNMFGDTLRDVLDPEVPLMDAAAPSLSPPDAGSDAPLVAIRDLKVTFETDGGSVIGVDGVSFSIRPGETVCVVGESGSGKSVTSLSLMRLVEFGGGRIAAGRLDLERPSGEVIDLAEADPATMQTIRGNEIGMIFQEPMTSLNPVFTIEQQLTDGLMVHKRLGKEAARARALDLLKDVRIPEPERRLGQYPHELSGGMRQRVVIAMAIACEPRLLIADEPTTALDVTIQAEILALIDRLKREKGMAVLFITHDMSVVAQMADRVVVMYRGRIVEQGPVFEIFESPREDYTRMLLAAVPRLGEMRGKDRPEPMALFGRPPREAPATAPTRRGTAGQALLQVSHLTTRFPVRGGVLRRTVGHVHAVEDVSFTVQSGETLALVGESGCGKSTCGRSILRLVEAHAGDVSLDGWDIRKLAPLDLRRARREMQMIFQDPFASLNPYRRLSDQVAEPLLNFGLAKGSELDDRVATLFDRVELPRSFLRRFPHELSGGQRQRVAIARAIAPNPKLVIADEAVSALDVSVQAQVLNLLMELQADLGLSFMFISHDMAVVERISHHVGVMYLGRLVEIGPRAAVLEDPRHPYTKSLLSAVPIADPRRRSLKENLAFKPLPSPIFPLGHRAEPSVYDEVGPGHLVLRQR